MNDPGQKSAERRHVRSRPTCGSSPSSVDVGSSEVARPPSGIETAEKLLAVIVRCNGSRQVVAAAASALWRLVSGGASTDAPLSKEEADTLVSSVDVQRLASQAMGCDFHNLGTAAAAVAQVDRPIAQAMNKLRKEANIVKHGKNQGLNHKPFCSDGKMENMSGISEHLSALERKIDLATAGLVTIADKTLAEMDMHEKARQCSHFDIASDIEEEQVLGPCGSLVFREELFLQAIAHRWKRLASAATDFERGQHTILAHLYGLHRQMHSIAITPTIASPTCAPFEASPRGTLSSNH